VAALTAGTNVTISAGGTIASTDTNTMGSGFTVSATTDTNATTITQGDDLLFTAGTGITCETTADGTVTITNTVSDTNTTYTKASFDLDHLFTLVDATADTSEHLGTFTGSTVADSVTIKVALQSLETAVETKGVTAGSSSIVTVGTIGTGTWQGTAIGASYVATLNQNTTGSAATLTTPRAINGVNFNGSAPITVTAAGSTLSDTVTVAKGGTAQTSYTNGQLLVGNTTGNTLAKATLTAGDNVTITNGAGAITIAATDTNTTYTKASFDLDHLFTLVDAAADTSENLGTFTGSTISDSVTIKAAIQALETAVETKGVTAGSSSIVTVGTIGTGTWQGTTIAVDQGGTGQTSYTNGQLLVGNTTGNTLTKATLTAGDNVSITNGTGSITIAATDTNTMGSGFTVSATTDSNATTITQGDDLMFTAGTGITCETTANGTVTIASTVTGGGDVAAGTDFSTAGVIMAANGTSKTIDVPGTALTTNGQAMTVSSTESTPFIANGGAGTVNCTFVFAAGTGDTNNNAIMKLTSGTVASSYLYMGDTDTANIGYIRYKQNGDEMIFHVNSADALTIDSSQVATFAAGIVSTAASNTLGATSFNDANITNVGSLACDSVVVDAAGIGLDVVFGGTTGLNKMTLTDNLADALNITESSNSYMKFVTTNSGESIVTSKNLVQHPDMTNTALTSQSGSVVINANLGNYFSVAVTGNITGLDIQNAVVGQKILIRFAWSGSYSVTGYTDTVIWPGGTALSATASGVDMVGFICTTASSAFDAFVIGEDIKTV
jgi:hypothetical protein